MKKNSLLKKILSFSIGTYINIIISLITVPLITRLLSPNEFGIASLVTTTINILSVLCILGLDQGFVRFFYEEKEIDRGQLLYNCLKYPIVIFILLSFCLVLFYKKISIFILGYMDINILYIIEIGILLYILNRFGMLVVRMQQKGKTYSFFTVLFKITEFIFIILLYQLFKNNYKTLILANLLAIFIVTFLVIATEKKIWKFYGNIKTTKKEILKYSFPLSFTLILTWVFSSSDKIMLKYFSNLTQVGIYSGAFKIVSILTVLQTGFNTCWTPIVYEHYKNDPKDLKFYKNTNDYVSLLFFTLGIWFLILRYGVVILLGTRYSEAMYVAPMLIFIPIMYILSETTVMGIELMKKTYYFIYISIAVTIFNIFGNIIFIPYFGAKGAALSTGLSYILFFILRTYFSIRLINFGFDLKRIILVTVLIVTYALSLTFITNMQYAYLYGICLQLIILYLYKNTIKEIYHRYIKR